MGMLTEQLAVKIEKQLISLQVIQTLELALIGPRPQYTWKGQFLEWGEDMPPGFRATMDKEAETAVLLDAAGVPVKFLFVDAYNILREGDLC